MGDHLPYIFVSYSHKDEGYAHSLAEALEHQGFSVWIDDRIDYGTQWPRIIEQYLDDCGAFVVVMTPRSYESDWVQSELSRAKRKGKPIFPLYLKGEEPWLSVETTQYVDVRDGRLPPPDFYEGLAQIVPRRTTGGVTSPTQLKRARPSPFLRYGVLVLGLVVSVGIGYGAAFIVYEFIFRNEILPFVIWPAVGLGGFILTIVITRKIWGGK